jgi:hypothetical protein
MNQYAAMAQTHWARFLPTRYSQINDPDSYFSILGQEVADEIDDLTQQLTENDAASEDYLSKVGRLNSARQQAREKVLAERVLLAAEPGSPMDENTEAQQPPSKLHTDWIPVTEDPNHPWWRDQQTSSS